MPAKPETNVSYLSAMYYVSAVLLILAAVFSTLSGNYLMAGVWFILGVAILIYRLLSSRDQKSGPTL